MFELNLTTRYLARTTKISASLHNRGDILRGQGDLVGALAAHREGIKIDEQLLTLNPALSERNLVSVHFVQTGAVLYSLGRLDDAWKFTAVRLSSMTL